MFERFISKTVQRDFMGTTYTVCNPAHSIEAKLVILKNRLFINNYSAQKADQHAADIAAYFKWLQTREGTKFKEEITPPVEVLPGVMLEAIAAKPDTADDDPF